MSSDSSSSDNHIVDSVMNMPNLYVHRAQTLHHIQSNISGVVATPQPPKINKNPLNLSAEQVQTMVLNGSLVIGPPPAKKHCTADHWKNEIMHFLFDSITGEELEHWYYCGKCYWVHNCILRDGNKTIREHADKHKDERRYEFTRMELANLLASATSFGTSNGTVPTQEFVKHLPFPNKW